MTPNNTQPGANGIIPINAVMTRPDEHWEYLDTLRTHTIELMTEMRNISLLAANKNLIMYHKDINQVSNCIEQILSSVQQGSVRLEQIHALHKGRTGYAMREDMISEFLGISEQYTLLQQWLLPFMDAYATPLSQLTEIAYQAAKAAAEQNPTA